MIPGFLRTFLPRTAALVVALLSAGSAWAQAGLAPTDPTGFSPDSLWADRAAVDSAFAYRDSLRAAEGSSGLLAEDPLRLDSGTRFQYNSSYAVGQSNSAWNNDSQYELRLPRLTLKNATTISLDRYLAGGTESPRQTRTSLTEVAYRLSRRLSLGSRANLYRFLSSAGGLITSTDREDRDEYQLSLRSELHPAPGAKLTLNSFGGYLGNERPTYFRRGLSGDANGTATLGLGRLANANLSGQINGNATRATLDEVTGNRASTHDRSRNARGSLSLLPASKVNLTASVSRRHVQTQSPVTAGTLGAGSGGPAEIQEILTRSGDQNVSLQGRFTPERTFTFSARSGEETRDYNVQTSQSSGREDRGWSAEAQEYRLGTRMRAAFRRSWTENDYTRRTATLSSGGVSQTVPAGYSEESETRSLSGEVSRALGRRLNVKIDGSIDLTRSRFFPVPDSRANLVDRDLLRQLIRMETRYDPGRRWTSGVTYQQDLAQTVNLPSSASGSSFDERVYRLTWTWSYQLSKNLTADQRNIALATYRKFRFPSESNPNRLTLEYSFVTTLRATVGSRLRIVSTHQARYQPSGDYVVDPLTGLESFFKSDESQLHSLDASIAYSPAPWITFNLKPVYQQDRRLSPGTEGLILLRNSNSLRMLGGIAVDRPVGGKGSLRGDLNRSFSGDRATSYVLGVPDVSARSETDFWQGRLDFTWTY